ncbi:hypothetical protein DFH27DRAFT_558266 [Peziza echinospora]|nr:hypothetical protein DFH27DRAFT_558266 [Peziza echinospora]
MIIRTRSQTEKQTNASSSKISDIFHAIITCSWLSKKPQTNTTSSQETSKRHKPSPRPNAPRPPPLVRRNTGLDIPKENELHLITSDRNSKAPESVYSIRMDFGGPGEPNTSITPNQSRPQSQHRTSSSSPSPILPGFSFSTHDFCSDSEATLGGGTPTTRSRSTTGTSSTTIAPSTSTGCCGMSMLGTTTSTTTTTSANEARISFDKYDLGSLAPCHWDFCSGPAGGMFGDCRARKCSIIQEGSEPGSACGSRKHSIAATSTHSQSTVPLGVYVTSMAGLGAVAE